MFVRMKCLDSVSMLVLVDNIGPTLIHVLDHISA